ncbi:MAG: D-glycero-beta-D-manno-heptose 1-phosphate adenylyltransferase [Candidatus Methylomirabilales bacterium]
MTEDEMPTGYAGKLKALEELVPIVRDLRRQGKRVVFTNGCFDLLHHGHVRYLDQAKGLGDVLVVAINSDASVRALKGPDRPVMSHAERSEVIAALAAVDYVLIFEELDPEKLIRALEPDLLVKGGDWPVDQVVGRQIVEGRGGRVCTLPYVEGASSSQLLRRIREGKG